MDILGCGLRAGGSGLVRIMNVCVAMALVCVGEVFRNSRTHSLSTPIPAAAAIPDPPGGGTERDTCGCISV